LFFEVKLPVEEVSMLKHKLLILAAWITAAGLIYGTLARVGLVYEIYFKLSPWLGHPNMAGYAASEHVVVFAIFGALVCLAYPNRIIFVCGLVVLGAATLEYLQTLTPDRHGTFLDAYEKIGGGLLGIIAARTALHLYQRSRKVC
jgi:hypothetical protein